MVDLSRFNVPGGGTHYQSSWFKFFVAVIRSFDTLKADFFPFFGLLSYEAKD